MALDDFDSAPADIEQSMSEDEDLFNFPVVDLGAQAAPLPAPVPAPAPTPARTPLSGQPSFDSSAGARATRAPSAPPSDRASVRPVAQLADEADDLDDADDAGDAPDDEIERAPLPSAKSTARRSALTSVTADEEPPLAEAAPAIPARVRRPSLLASPSRTIWLVVGGVVVLNIAAFAFVWQSNRSFRAGLEGLRDDLVVTLHDVRRSASEASSPVEAARSAQPLPTETPEPKHSSSTPLSAFEETTLLLARQEIEAGEQVQARKRLYRLLAVADRIDSDLRKSIEGQASYSIGDSYRKQADARRETQP